jgi:8-hydroxy-5-deazaflavin:NADPH oxidoreductase
MTAPEDDAPTAAADPPGAPDRPEPVDRGTGAAGGAGPVAGGSGDPGGTDRPERVAIVGGAGSLGFGLALRLAAAGVPVAIGSRDAQRAQEAAERIAARVPGAQATGAGNAEAAAGASVVVVSVPFRSQAETLRVLAAALVPGQLVVDVTVPLAVAAGGRPTRLLGVWQGSAAEQAAELLGPEVALVSALHTVSATALEALEQPLAEDVLVCGDRRADKQRLAALLHRIPGLRAVDCGRLEQSRMTESLTPLLIGLNARYKTHAGISITGLPALRP